MSEKPSNHNDSSVHLTTIAPYFALNISGKIPQIRPFEEFATHEKSLQFLFLGHFATGRPLNKRTITSTLFG
jgi:hypothetical protein